MAMDRSVVRVDLPNSFGTGFAVCSDGVQSLVMTNYHVVQELTVEGGDTTAEIVLPGGEDWYEASAVNWDEQSELAILRVPNLALNPLRFAPHTIDVPARAEVILYGYFAYGDAPVAHPGASPGKIVSIYDDEHAVRTISSDYVGDSGTSGGPVMLDHTVIGVQYGGNKAGINYATHAFGVHEALMHWTGMGEGSTITRMLKSLLLE